MCLLKSFPCETVSHLCQYSHNKRKSQNLNFTNPILYLPYIVKKSLICINKINKKSIFAKINFFKNKMNSWISPLLHWYTVPCGRKLLQIRPKYQIWGGRSFFWQLLFVWWHDRSFLISVNCEITKLFYMKLNLKSPHDWEKLNIVIHDLVYLISVIQCEHFSQFMIKISPKSIFRHDTLISFSVNRGNGLISCDRWFGKTSDRNPLYPLKYWYINECQINKHVYDVTWTRPAQCVSMENFCAK